MPAVALDAQGGRGPLRAEAVDGLGHRAPGPLYEIVAVENEGDRDALAGGQHAERRLVGYNHPHFGADVPFGDVDIGQGSHGEPRPIRLSDLDLILRAEGLALDEQDLGVMEQTIEERRGQRGVIVEDLRPTLKCSVRGDHD